MFSYFKDGITDTHPEKIIDLQGLVNLIRNNPCQTQIETIRKLKSEGDMFYKGLKRKLPYITPNCIVKCRGFKTDMDFEKNFIQSSQYIYFDIDNVSNVVEVKKELIEKFKDTVSLICISSGGQGLTLLFKITNPITSKIQFIQVWEEIRNTILKDVDIDPACKDIGRAMFVSSDYEPYYNYENEISVIVNDTNQAEPDKKGIKQPILSKGSNISNEPYNIHSINEIMRKICLKTRVEIENPVLDLKPIDFSAANFPKLIRDGHKHRIYKRLIHSLVYLNPNLEVDYIFSYVNFINNYFADPPMEFGKLVRHFRFVYSTIKDDSNYQFQENKIKSIHFNPNAGLNSNEKRDIASKLNGKKRRNDSIVKIRLAKEHFESIGKEITQKLVAEFTGLSISTVKRHYKEEPIDIKKAIESINDIRPSKTNKIGYNDTFSQSDIKPPIDEFVHPECPGWVLSYNSSCHLRPGMKLPVI
jgi:hypothetical protein